MNNKLQDRFLSAIHRQGIPINIYLVNGLKRQGTIQTFNKETIAIKDPDQVMTQMIYKHAISSILPIEDVDFDFNDKE